jgi:hypothetical protein
MPKRTGDGDPQAESTAPPAPGLFLRGVVTARRRRIVGKREVELVTYQLSSGHEVSVWAPKSCFSIGESIEVQVVVKVYAAPTGPRWSLEIPSDDGSF